jgi:hypothetical protein
LSPTPVWAVQGFGTASGGPDSDDETHGIAVDFEGNPCVTGFLHPNAPNPFVNEGPIVLVASFNGISSAPRWTRIAKDGNLGANNNQQDVGNGIATDSVGCMHVTGGFTEDLVFPPLVSPLENYNASPDLARDMFVGKMCPTCCYPLVLCSSTTVIGPYTPELGAVVDPVAMTITVPVSGLRKFYQVKGPCLVKIVKIVVSGGNVVLTYEFQ